MNKEQIRFYRERWRAGKEIELHELRVMRAEDHWRQINRIARFAILNGWWGKGEKDDEEVYLRWAKLKNQT